MYHNILDSCLACGHSPSHVKLGKQSQRDSNQNCAMTHGRDTATGDFLMGGPCLMGRVSKSDSLKQALRRPGTFDA